jgi:hypothetical protein
MEYSIIFIAIVFLIVAILGKIKFKKPNVEISDVENSKVSITSENSNITLTNIKDSKINIK